MQKVFHFNAPVPQSRGKISFVFFPVSFQKDEQHLETSTHEKEETIYSTSKQYRTDMKHAVHL